MIRGKYNANVTIYKTKSYSSTSLANQELRMKTESEDRRQEAEVKVRCITLFQAERGILYLMPFFASRYKLLFSRSLTIVQFAVL